MQNFTDIPSSRSLSDSLIEILNNDKTGISCNSGTTFPTTNQQVGMLCYRTDQLKLYQLIGVNPDNWRFIMDLSSGIDSQFATKLNSASYTAADVLAKLLTVDGAGNWIYTLSDNTLDHTNPNASGTADQVGESFAVRTDDLNAYQAAVDAGLGVGFLARYVARRNPDLVPLLPYAIPRFSYATELADWTPRRT